MPRGSEIETTAAAPVAAPAAPAAPAPKKAPAPAAPASAASKKAAPAAGASKKVASAAPAAPAAAPASVPAGYASIVQRSIFDSGAAEAAAAKRAESDVWYEKEAERATARPPEDPALLRAAQERLGNVRKLREEAQIGPVTAGTKTERELQRVRRQLKEGSILPAAMSTAKLAYEAMPKTPLTVARMGSSPTLTTEVLQYRLGKKLAGFEETPAPTYDGTQYPSVKPEVVTRAKPGQFGQTEATIIPDRPPQTPSETALNRPVVGAREALDIGRAYTRALGQEKWARSLIDERLSDPDSTPDQIRGAAAARQVALKEVARLRASLREYGWMDDEEVERTFGAPK